MSLELGRSLEAFRGVTAEVQRPDRALEAHAVASVVLALVVSVWRWYRPGGPATLDEVRELITDACLRVGGSGGPAN